MMTKVMPLKGFIVMCIIAILSIQGCSDSAHSNRIAELITFSSIDNIDNIDFTKRESIVVLTEGNIAFPEDDEPRLLFINKGDCSVCISETIDYLTTYLSVQNLPITYIGLKGDGELFNYFISQSFSQESIDFNNRLRQIPIVQLNYNTDINAGLYLIVNNRVIDYVQWKVK